MGMGPAVVVWVLFIVGIYFLVWHYPPLPGNHESIGLDSSYSVHIVHAVVGIVLIIGAVLIRRRARARSKKPAEPPTA